MKGGGGKKKYTKKYTAPITEAGAVYGGASKSDSCRSISFSVRLQRPTAIVKTLIVGDILIVRNNKAEVRALKDTGQLCGIINSPQNVKLIECMLKGYSYQAIVDAIYGTSCDVTVQIAS